MLLLLARTAGLEVAADGHELVVRGPRRHEDCAEHLLELKDEILRLLEDEAAGRHPYTDAPPLARSCPITTDDSRVIAAGDLEVAEDAVEQPGLFDPVSLVEQRLIRLLEGRLWHDRDGWWPKDTGLSRTRAQEMASEALSATPAGALPEPHKWVAAQGADAGRVWRQVCSCLVERLGWSAERSSRAATYVVGTQAGREDRT